METSVEIRQLERTELSRIAEIDRTEQIDVVYEQRGTELVVLRGNWSAEAWDPDGHGEHSVEAQRHALKHYTDAGGFVLGASNTVHFYLGRGYELMAEPLPELFELEPEDVHLRKSL